MTDSIHNHQILGKQDAINKENPPRAHVERTRDVFKESKPAAANEDTNKEPKMQARRAEQQTRTKAHKRKSAEAKEKEELSADDQKAKDLAEHEVHITYSNYYYGEPRLSSTYVGNTIFNTLHFSGNCELDDDYEYRHVTLPKEIAQWLPHYDLLSEDEWRSLGVRQSLGWEHYMVHNPEPHVLLFKREKDYQKKHPPKKSKQEGSNASNDEDDTENKEAYNKKPRRI